VVGARSDYGAVGEVVEAAAALQSAARTGAVLVGLATRAATEGIFEWGRSEEVAPIPGAKPLVASYVERAKARPSAQRGQRRATGPVPVVGRQGELAVLDEVVRETTSGNGSVLFIVGEPGLGKTRLVQECRKRFMAWVGTGTGRLPLWLEGRAASYASLTPYGLYQQLLSSWVGVALEEGNEVARPALERAMKAVFGGPAGDVALLAQMMGVGADLDGARIARLSPEGLQRATFAAVRSVVARLMEKGPTVLALEDLHWADPTSLRLTEELAALAADGPLLVLATRRPEPDPGVSNLESSLADAPCPVRTLALSALSEQAEQALARSLVGPGASQAVIAATCAGVEGNPLFLEERLSSLVETGALVKDGKAWQVSGSPSTEVPELLDRLIRARVDRLGPWPREVIVSASVIGREFSLRALAAVAEPAGDLGGALAELCATGLLSQVRQGPDAAYRFRHALIQEAIYQGMLRNQRRQLHARAAWGLEAISAERLEEVAAVLGHHYAAAGEAERAVNYFELAADHAVSVFANYEAISSYRSALAVVGVGRPPDELMARATMQLRAKLAYVLHYRSVGRKREALEVLHEAIGLVDEQRSLQASRLQNLLGLIETDNHDYDAALAAFDAAEAHLGDSPQDQDQEVVALWVEIMLEGRALVYYFIDEPARVAAVLAEVGPVVQARGGPAEKQLFQSALLRCQLVQRRHRVDEEIIATARAALAAVEEVSDDHYPVTRPTWPAYGWNLYALGRCLVLHGDLDEAEERLNAALAIANRVGETALPLRCVSLLALTALRRHDAIAVAALATRALEAAEATSWPEYVAIATASLAWLAWREARFAEVERRAEEALALWAKTTGWQPLHWICLWPLIAVRLGAGNVSEAVAASRQLLEPSQQRLPDELEPVVEAAVAAWDGDDHGLAGSKLAQAVELAERLRYL
jgi:tetratricopeptide (TPR) repeat protein